MIGIILVAVLLLLLISGAWKPATPGVRQMGDLIKIKNALEMYHQKYLKYPQSKEMPPSIEEFLSEIPKSPKGKPYVWMNNIGEEQKFCIWTELENSTKYKIYFLVSPCGESQSGHLPATLDECCELSKP